MLEKNNMIIQESSFAGDINVTKKDANTIEFIAVLQEADKPNRNGRIYSKDVLQKALQSAYIQERLATDSFYGEAGHPLDTSVQRQMTVDLRNVAFLIKEFWWEGDLLKARIETADTAVGHDMKGLIEQGSKVAFSLRAQGNVRTNPVTGLVEVEDGLQICSYDWVQNPSHAKAFLERICEATSIALYKTRKAGLTASVLCESEELYNNGMLIDLNKETPVHELDYTKNYTPVYKKVEDIYVPEEGDNVLSMNSDETIIKNESTNIIKKVVTEDYLVKDIRHRLLEIAGNNTAN